MIGMVCLSGFGFHDPRLRYRSIGHARDVSALAFAASACSNMD
jgi:hypothetical protein